MPKMSNIFPLFTCITLLFILLKATEVVTWSWFVVFSPLLLLFGIGAAIMAIGVLTTVGIARIIDFIRK